MNGAKPRLLEPGLPQLEAGTERYRVHGGGSIVISLAAGDRITSIDLEGAQLGEIATFNPDGKVDLAAFDASPDGILSVFDFGPHAPNNECHTSLDALRERGIDAANAPALLLFGRGSRPGERELLVAQRNTFCLVAAPGKPMRVDGQDPPTDLSVLVQRAHPTESTEVPLPPPLGTCDSKCVSIGKPRWLTRSRRGNSFK